LLIAQAAMIGVMKTYVNTTYHQFSFVKGVFMADQPKSEFLAEFPAHTVEQWRAAVEKLLEGKPYDKVMLTPTYEGLVLKPLYTQEDVANLRHVHELPGFPYYARGTEALGYLQHPWKVAQEIGYSTVEECNAALVHDLSRGLSAVNILLDQATQLGLDPHEAKTGEVGKTGVSLTGLSNLCTLLKNVNISKLPVMVDAGPAALAILGLFVAYFEWHLHKPPKLHGSIGFDPLGYLAQHGTLPMSLQAAYDDIAVMTKWAKTNAPQLRTILVKSAMYHNAGANIITELAAVLATSLEYIFQMQARGLDLSTILQHFQWELSIGSNFFMEIAKLRVARMLWPKVIEKLGGKPEEAKIQIHGRGSSFNKTKYDMYVNMLRSTTEAFSGILGGVNSMHVACFDEAIRLPNEFSRRIARNQQLILQEECHLDRLIDPVGGTWYIETLADQMAQEVWKILGNISNQGGMLAVLQNSWIQNTIQATAQQRKENFCNRKDVMVGINMYANVLETAPEIKPVDYAKIQNQRCQETQRLTINFYIASGQEIADISNAFYRNATLGQITEVLRKPKDIPTVKALLIHRASEPYEILRDTMAAYQQKTGKKMKVFLANMGSADQHRARAEFSRSFFEIGGFEVKDPTGFAKVEDAIASALESQAQVVVICSTDETYPQLVPQLVSGIKAKNPKIMVILAGYPKDQVEAHKKSGIDEFIAMLIKFSAICWLS